MCPGTVKGPTKQLPAKRSQKGGWAPLTGLNTQWQAGRSVSSSLPEMLTALPRPLSFMGPGTPSHLLSFPARSQLFLLCKTRGPPLEIPIIWTTSTWLYISSITICIN